jgi:hypothetical protein
VFVNKYLQNFADILQSITERNLCCKEFNEQ